ncbi:Xaa-Pro peptidase family protein [Halogeometricum sp. S1BR25-6]|uniref:Xaa-Pro peptidase family protein n=1 Tax=Halogeometricum salsisoli TaxID=2950536 RepID=A0ABU2GCV7_9EURY|nr:Xaa-Pro peptidase family protein [Halogeometricum sp. S1BR25-6]MDS0298637.1 Xaa-Pro peptidase family protein [Halogeometricum sp. S1BR25-6]
MDPDLSSLDALLGEEDADGYLVDDTSHNSTQQYLSGFEAHDPFVTLYTPEETVLLVSTLEFGRAKKQSRADEVRRLAEYDYRDVVAEHGPAEAKARVHAAFLDDYGVSSVLTPERFPLGPADGLRDREVSVTPDHSDRVTEIRATKTDEEVEHVRAAQEANEASMRAAEDLIADAGVEDGRLVHDGEPLTSERVKEEIEVTLLRHGCGLDDTIVACGADAADPHDQGSGPLRADEPIIVDIFPRSKTTGYHADMTRTFLKGDPSETLLEWYDLTHEALEAAFDAVEPGVTGADVHDVVCDVYEGVGHDTLRSNSMAETGFIHSTGHGVGLDVHELPSLSPSGEELKPGHVITVEPGLYDPSVGGVRIEDIAVVTEGGYENLTSYPVELVV